MKNYVHPETGEIINKDRLDVGGLGKARFILKPGGTLGDLYTQADLKRDNNGMVEISPSGTITTESNLPDIKLGSVFPKCNLAWSNQFSWNGFSVSALFTARIGGIVYSATEAAMDQYGVSEVSALARDNGGVLINGRNMIAPADLLHCHRFPVGIATILHLQRHQHTPAGSKHRLHTSAQMAAQCM